jgi:hypothetical protein
MVSTSRAHRQLRYSYISVLYPLQLSTHYLPNSPTIETEDPILHSPLLIDLDISSAEKDDEAQADGGAAYVGVYRLLRGDSIAKDIGLRFKQDALKYPAEVQGFVYIVGNSRVVYSLIH